MTPAATSPWLAWLCIAASCLAVGLYELRVRRLARLRPQCHARTFHARIRAGWVAALMRHPGHELLAVQTIRNSVMSASIMGSTAALALMGTATLASTRLRAPQPELIAPLLHPTPRLVLLALLIGVLFATFLLSVMAVRYFNHAGYMLSTLSEGEQRETLARLAERTLGRAGNYYSLSMRTFLWLAPVAAGIVHPLLMPVATLALVRVLMWFDEVPPDLPG